MGIWNRKRHHQRPEGFWGPRYSNFTQNRYRYLPVLVEFSPGIFKDTGIFQTMADSSNKAHV